MRNLNGKLRADPDFFGALLLLCGALVGGAASPVIDLRLVGTTPRLSIHGALGATNQILAAEALTPDAWVILTNLIAVESPAIYMDTFATNPSQRYYRVKAELPPPPNMALVPAGGFTMGDALVEGSADERPLHAVWLSAFYLDRYEVSKALWGEVKAWSDQNGFAYDNPGQSRATNHPVHSINWFDAVKWCNARSLYEERVPAYYTDAGLIQVYKTGQVAPFVKQTANGYRLPTEAEWEKAARGGLGGKRFAWGDTITHSNANYTSRTNELYDVSPTRGRHPAFSTTEPCTSPGGAFPYSGYGFYDLVGNVWEWCWDWYGPYNATPQSDPSGPATGSNRCNRGGSWWGNADGCRASDRSGIPPTSIYNTLGFRTVLSVAEQ